MVPSPRCVGVCSGSPPASVVHPSIAGQLCWKQRRLMMVWKTWRLFFWSWVRAQMGRPRLATWIHLTLGNLVFMTRTSKPRLAGRPRRRGASCKCCGSTGGPRPGARSCCRADAPCAGRRRSSGECRGPKPWLRLSNGASACRSRRRRCVRRDASGPIAGPPAPE